MSKIERLRKVEFSHDDLARLSQDEQVLLTILSFSISETNALWRAFLCGKQDTSETEAPITQAIAIQRHVLLRTWSAKLYELIIAMEKLGKDKNTDQDLRDFISKSISRINHSNAGSTPILTERFRHNSTNHLSLGAAKKALKKLNSSSEINMYFSEREANSFFPLGEEVFFAGVYNHFLLAEDGPKSLDSFEHWLDWTQEATKELIHIMDEFLCSFVFTPEHLVKWSWVDLSVDDSLAGCIADHQTPIFLQEETQ